MSVSATITRGVSFVAFNAPLAAGEAASASADYPFDIRHGAQKANIQFDRAVDM